MLLRHDYVTLYANGIRYLEKAPLLYWSMAAAMRVSQLLGHGSARCLAVAARIPLALTVLALAFAVEAFARRAFRSTRAGLYAALHPALVARHLSLHPHHPARRDGLPLAHAGDALLLADGSAAESGAPS